jgi:predicted dehydrogenase
VTQPPRIGIVGCGAIARAHADAFKQCGATIVSVFDVADAAAREFAQEIGAQVAPSLEAMADSGELDAVSICSPPAAHLANCRPFLAAGLPILCEKPFETDLARAEELAALVRQAGTVFMVGFCHRFHPSVIELTKLVRSGRLGEPAFLRNIFGIHYPVKGLSHVNPALAGGGAMMGNGVHSIDLFRHLVGEPTRVQATGAAVVQDVPVEDLALMHLSAGDRAFGDIVSSYSLHFCPASIEWYGTKGAAILTYWKVDEPELRFRVEGDPRKEWTPVDSSTHPDRFVGEVTHFLECVRSGATPSITAEDGLASQRVVDAAYRSLRENRSIAIPAPSPSGRGPG